MILLPPLEGSGAVYSSLVFLLTDTGHLIVIDPFNQNHKTTQQNVTFKLIVQDQHEEMFLIADWSSSRLAAAAA